MVSVARCAAATHARRRAVAGRGSGVGQVASADQGLLFALRQFEKCIYFSRAHHPSCAPPPSVVCAATVRRVRRSRVSGSCADSMGQNRVRIPESCADSRIVCGFQNRVRIPESCAGRSILRIVCGFSESCADSQNRVRMLPRNTWSLLVVAAERPIAAAADLSTDPRRRCQHRPVPAGSWVLAGCRCSARSATPRDGVPAAASR